MGRTILVADDSTMSRMMIKRALPEGWAEQVLEAANGQEALDQLAANAVDVLFLDLTMPEVDGFAVLEQLSGEGGAMPKTFVISADIQEESLKLCQERGALDFVPKPIRAEALAELLQRHGLLA